MEFNRGSAVLLYHCLKILMAAKLFDYFDFFPSSLVLSNDQLSSF